MRRRARRQGCVVSFSHQCLSVGEAGVVREGGRDNRSPLGSGTTSVQERVGHSISPTSNTSVLMPNQAWSILRASQSRKPSFVLACSYSRGRPGMRSQGPVAVIVRRAGNEEAFVDKKSMTRSAIASSGVHQVWCATTSLTGVAVM